LAKNVTFLAPKPLLRLLNAFNDRVRITGELRPGESFDFQCALMSLPNRLGTDISAVSRSVPYLTAETTICSQWGKLGSSAGFKIGICWQGNSKAKADKGRSVSLEKLFPISRLEGVRLISLQKLQGLEQLDRLPHGMRVETLGDGVDSGSDAFVDTAAVMEQLDLIITTDTAIAHLAGALGRPTWVALQYFPEWRWLLNRDDSPWYPTMKLFRQPERGNWDAVFAQMAIEVQKVMQRTALN
jgi:Glycosyltransferase family 9 (heptosyltransferase)